MSTLIARLIGDEAVHELVLRPDGCHEMRTFIRDADMDREVTRDEAMAWCDTVSRCGGTVLRGVAGRRAS